METTQLVSIVFSFVTATLFGTVAYVLARRDISPELRGANNAFVVWWGSIAVSAVIGGTMLALAVSGFRELPFFIASSMVTLGLICLALWGLLYYLLVLVADARRWAVPLGLAYAALAVYLAWFTLHNNPTTVELGKWAVTLGPRPPRNLVQEVVLLGLILGPQMVAAVTYLSLYVRVQDRVAKTRILIVGLSILLWFGSAIVSALAGTAESDVGQWTSRIIGLVAASAILYAFVGLTPKAGVEASEGEGDEDGSQAPASEGPRRLAQWFPS